MFTSLALFLKNKKCWSNCNKTRTHNHLVRKRTLNHLDGWVFVYELSGCGFESRSSHLSSRYCICFEQGVIVWKVSKYGVFSGPYFPAFGLNTENTFPKILSQNARKYGPEKTPYLEIFHAVRYFRNSGSYRVWIHTETRTWHSKNTQSNNAKIELRR